MSKGARFSMVRRRGHACLEKSRARECGKCRIQRTNAVNRSTPELGDTAPVEPGASRRIWRRERGSERRANSSPAESGTFPKLSLLNPAPDSGVGMLNPAPSLWLSMLNPTPIPIKTIKSFPPISPTSPSGSCPQDDGSRCRPAPVKPKGRLVHPLPDTTLNVVSSGRKEHGRPEATTRFGRGWQGARTRQAASVVYKGAGFSMRSRAGQAVRGRDQRLKHAESGTFWLDGLACRVFAC